MLKIILGAMDELKLGDPMCLDTDIGPVIDEAARDLLAEHVSSIASKSKLLRKLELPSVGTQRTSPTLACAVSGRTRSARRW